VAEGVRLGHMNAGHAKAYSQCRTDGDYRRRFLPAPKEFCRITEKDGKRLFQPLWAVFSKLLLALSHGLDPGESREQIQPKPKAPKR
jgi:hypothetical protein